MLMSADSVAARSSAAAQSVSAATGSRGGGGFSSSVSRRWLSAGEHYDVAVGGGGPAGYVAAIRAAQAGKKTVCVESRGALGGTCLNVGCIPTKAMLHASEVYRGAKKHGPKYGFKGGNAATLDYPQMVKGRDTAVAGLTKGIEFLLKKNKVDYAKGHGRILGPHEIEISPLPAAVAAGRTAATGRAGQNTAPGGGSGVPSSTSAAPIRVKCANMIIATGSTHAELPGGAVKIDEERVLSSTGALTTLQRPPKKLVIVGAGAIGLEFAVLFARLDCQEVVVLEFLPTVGGNVDKDVSDALAAAIKKTYPAIKICTNTKVTGADLRPDDGGVTVHAQDAAGKPLTFDAEKMLVAVGRKPNTHDLGLDNLNVTTDRVGRIPVDEGLRVTGQEEAGVYAIGDVVAGPMLAHKAEEDGCFVVEKICGHRPKDAAVDFYDFIPAVIYSDPEVAVVGSSEKSLKQQGRKYLKGSFPFAANSRAKANQEPVGFVKTLVDPETKLILGAAIVGNGASELIQQYVMAMRFKIRADELGNCIFPHPTLSEAVKESCLAATSKAVHM